MLYVLCALRGSKEKEPLRDGGQNAGAGTGTGTRGRAEAGAVRRVKVGGWF